MTTDDNADKTDEDEEERFSEFKFGFFDFLFRATIIFCHSDNIIEEDAKEEETDKGVGTRKGVFGGAIERRIEKKNNESSRN